MLKALLLAVLAAILFMVYVKNNVSGPQASDCVVTYTQQGQLGQFCY